MLFLLKGTFYIDLFMQTNKKFGLLIECINHGLIYLKKSILTSQVSLNIRSSVDNAGNFIREKLDIHKVAMSKNIPNEGISMKAVFHERFEVTFILYSLGSRYMRPSGAPRSPSVRRIGWPSRCLC